MMTRFFLFWVAWCAASMAVVASAGVSIERKRSSIGVIQAALEPYHTEFITYDPSDGFPSAPADISTLATGAATFLSNGGPASLVQYGPEENQGVTGRSAGAVSMDSPITILFQQPQDFVAVDALGLDAGERIQFTVHFGLAAIPPVTVFGGDDDADPATPSFFGVWSDIPMSAVEVSGVMTTGAATGLASDNLFLATIIPEPSMMFLGIPIAMALGWRTRR